MRLKTNLTPATVSSMKEGEKRPLSCESGECVRPGPILGAAQNGSLRLCGEHYIEKVDSGEVNGSVKKNHSICTQCPATLCTDFGNGYMSTRDYDADTADYQKGSIYECPELRRSIHNLQDGMFVDDDGTVYFEMRSVKDLEDGL